MSEAPPWDFPYAPVPTAAADDDGEACDVVIATGEPTPAERIAAALGDALGDLEVEPLIARAPLFWARVRSATRARRCEVRDALEAHGVAVRYVASATRAGMATGAPLSIDGAAVSGADEWRARARSKPPRADDDGEGTWFLRDGGGVSVERAHCGEGEGARLAVIDDDGAEAEHLGLEAQILVGIDHLPRATSHGALMVAWATGCAGEAGFRGVAPSASPRLYAIPKPGIDVVSLALALARAALDGADVIVCATYVEGHTSPMLDDALEVATRLGRGGLGTAVVFPTGREASSPAGSMHSSWSLALGDPASDPRVFCVAPSARDGGWFMWKDRRGRLRPFANRGPAVRWLAPGDDIAYPFGDRARLFHAESSGASAIAAGVLLLVLATNPALRLRELDAIVTRTATPVPPEHDPRKAPLADPYDVLPRGADADGHSAKHGYGRVHAERACLSAAGPVLAALVAMGEVDAARASAALFAHARPWSSATACWAARAFACDAHFSHALRALLRHARLAANHPERQRAQAEGALARQVVLVLRAAARAEPPPPRDVVAELEALRAPFEDPARIPTLEPLLLRAAAWLWPDGPPESAPRRFGTRDVPL